MTGADLTVMLTALSGPAQALPLVFLIKNLYCSIPPMKYPQLQRDCMSGPELTS